MLTYQLLLVCSAQAGGSGERVFTDTSGRQVTAEIRMVYEKKITIKRHDGKIYTISLNKLSEEDRAYAKQWQEARTEYQKASDEERAAIQRRRDIAAFCIRKFGKQVGNGECWTLADEAFKESGAKRPDGELRVWGRLVDYNTEAIKPGDVVEFRTAKIPGYGITGPVHTAVVIEGGENGKCTLAEQNWANVKTVRNAKVDFSKLMSGDVWVYRPQ